ncbi:colanic acid biosynthesis acetyltransferase WcaF [compost metagenome]
MIFRPGARVKFPWKLSVGNRCWIGEDVWIHNQDNVGIGDDAVVSQGVFITTGSHAHRRDMALLTRPVVIEDGAWVTTRSSILGGSTIGRSALVSPNSVVGPNQVVGDNQIVRGNPAVSIGERFTPDGM